MLVKLNQIIVFGLIAFMLSMILYGPYIKLLKKRKAGQQIREHDVSGGDARIFNKLHQHKAWTPRMWGWVFLFVMWVMVGASILAQKFWRFGFHNTLFEREETYILLFGFFSMWLLWILDDILNIKGHWKVKWLSAKSKLIWMFIFAAFISRWFYVKLGIDYINLRPIAWKAHLWLFFPILTFIITIWIVNATNITDGLDGLAGWLMSIILFVLSVITFTLGTYISTAVLWILVATLTAFMLFNINPAKVFMWDWGAFALWWILSSLLFLLNMRMWIFIPFIVLFAIFILEVGSSALQIRSKKYLKKKLFTVAPLHLYFQNKWVKETTIVMKARLLQWILAAITLIGIFYQLNSGFAG